MRSRAHGIGAILSRLIREPPRTDNFSFLFQLASEKRVRRVTLSPLQFVQSRYPDLISQRFLMVLLFQFLLTSGVCYYRSRDKFLSEILLHLLAREKV